MATLFLTCGLQGSGKTTLARRLEQERPALRLTADEWLLELHPLSRPQLDDPREQIERLQVSVAIRALQLGIDVVIDWGIWGREERDHLREAARAAVPGVRVVLCVLDPPLDVLRERLSRRNAALPPGTFPITPEELVAGDAWFVRPTAEELALFDALLLRDR